MGHFDKMISKRVCYRMRQCMEGVGYNFLSKINKLIDIG